MAATLHVLRPQTPAIAGYLRVGFTGHRKLGELHAAGRLPYRRFVFDAAHFGEQIDLVKALKASGCEIVLDPNFAEMATLGRFGSSSIQKLAWAKLDQPWKPEAFDRKNNQDIATAIAEFVVSSGVHAILSPTHLRAKSNDIWRGIDLKLCERLRYELDRAGGSNIAIDFQLITSMAALKDNACQTEFVADICELPIENVWLRASGFGATATGAGTRHFIESVRELHKIGRPLVADMAGGFATLGAISFGAVGGMSHGVAQKESFRAADWNSPPKGGGGTAARAYIPELDRHFKDEQLQVLFDTKGGRSRLGCIDSSCCANGCEDVIESGHSHFITQRHRQLDDLSSVPEDRRAQHFLLRHLDPAIRTARFVTQLKIKDEKVMKAVQDAKSRMIRLRDSLADLDAGGYAETRSQAPVFRGGATAANAVFGR